MIVAASLFAPFPVYAIDSSAVSGNRPRIADRATSGRDSHAPSVCLYYADHPPVDILAQYDWIVVDAVNVTLQELTALRRYGAKVFAYLSLGEVDRTSDDFAGMSAEMFLGENTIWNSAIVDLAGREWSDHINARVRALKAAGYDGFFLDTLDSYMTLDLPPGDVVKQRKALTALIEDIHEWFPEGRLIFNRGFEILDEAGGHAAAIAAESLYYGWDPGNKTYVRVTDDSFSWLSSKLQSVREKYGVHVIAIDYLPPEQRKRARETAEKIASLGFIPWVSTPGLDYAGVGSIEPVPRRFMILYDSAEAPSLAYSSAHRFLAMPLEYMGYVIDYRSVRDTLPDYELKGRYAGVAAWFTDTTLPDARRFRDWLLRQVQSKVKLAFFGSFGFDPDPEFLNILGMAKAEHNPSKPVTVERDDGLAGFETKIRLQTRGQTPVRITNERMTSHFALRDADGAVYDYVFTGPWGGGAFDPYLLEPTHDENDRWILDPFRFLDVALRLRPFPAPDVTTESGRRLMMIHIDGDGTVNRSEFSGAPLSIDVIKNDILMRYRFPTTVSVIEAETSPGGVYPEISPLVEASAREIFRLPYVEIATHSYSHPFVWPGPNFKRDSKDFEYYHLPIKNYTVDLEREITGSAAYINARLAPPGKPVKVMLWSGNALPDENALRIAEKAGLYHLNGGDTDITRNNNSLTRVSAIGRPVGGYYQVYAPILNENVYTNLWTGPFYGYRRVIESFELTESPRRLKPISIYYHFYSGSRKAGVKALREVYEWAAKQETVKVWVSEFIDRVNGFRRAAVASMIGGGWKITGLGALRALRISKQAGWPDLARSVGVAGFADTPHARYVTLTGTQPVFLYLTDEKPGSVYLANANARVLRWRRERGVTHIGLAGHEPVQFAVGGASGACQVAWRKGIIAGEPRNGKVWFQFPVNDTGHARLECQ